MLPLCLCRSHFQRYRRSYSGAQCSAAGGWPCRWLPLSKCCRWLGLVLFLTKIESPFVALRHLLPFISIVPLGRELYLQLQQNGPLMAWGLTCVSTLILVAIAWQCFRTIERLFISPVEAAKEKAREQIGALSITLAQLDEMNGIVDGFVVDRMRYHAPQLTAARVAHQEPVAFGATQVQIETTKAQIYLCPNCESELSLGAYGSAKRYGHCKACKGA
jgi:hypothetical protein